MASKLKQQLKREEDEWEKFETKRNSLGTISKELFVSKFASRLNPTENSKINVI